MIQFLRVIAGNYVYEIDKWVLSSQFHNAYNLLLEFIGIVGLQFNNIQTLLVGGKDLLLFVVGESTFTNGVFAEGGVFKTRFYWGCTPTENANLRRVLIGVGCTFLGLFSGLFWLRIMQSSMKLFEKLIEPI